MVFVLCPREGNPLFKQEPFIVFKEICFFLDSFTKLLRALSITKLGITEFHWSLNEIGVVFLLISVITLIKLSRFRRGKRDRGVLGQIPNLEHNNRIVYLLNPDIFLRLSKTDRLKDSLFCIMKKIDATGFEPVLLLCKRRALTNWAKHLKSG